MRNDAVNREVGRPLPPIPDLAAATTVDAANRAGPVPKVSVVIPTLRRPEPLARALASAVNQVGLAPDEVEIVVIDNAPDRGARAQVADVTARAAVAVHYVHQPVLGVASARNAGVAATRAPLVAFLDDDEEAAPGWLAALVDTAERTGADAVFGPVRVRLGDPDALEHMSNRRFAGVFGRGFGHATGTDITGRHARLGTNNSLFRRDRCFLSSSPFDIALDDCGGEDSVFLRQLARSGRRLVWCAEGEVTEFVPPARATWRYVWRRRFLSGQIRSFVCVWVKPPQLIELLFWMAAGALQSVGGAIHAAVLVPIDRERAGAALANAAGGLGKVLWIRRLRPILYGRGLVS